MNRFRRWQFLIVTLPDLSFKATLNLLWTLASISRTRNSREISEEVVVFQRRGQGNWKIFNPVAWCFLSSESSNRKKTQITPQKSLWWKLNYKSNFQLIEIYEVICVCCFVYLLYFSLHIRAVGPSIRCIGIRCSYTRGLVLLQGWRIFIFLKISELLLFKLAKRYENENQCRNKKIVRKNLTFPH